MWEATGTVRCGQGQRAAAALEVLDATGLRVAERRALPGKALSSDRQGLRVRGKGGKERVVPLSQAARDAASAAGGAHKAAGAALCRRSGCCRGALRTARVHARVRVRGRQAAGGPPALHVRHWWRTGLRASVHTSPSPVDAIQPWMRNAPPSRLVGASCSCCCFALLPSLQGAGCGAGLGGTGPPNALSK